MNEFLQVQMYLVIVGLVMALIMPVFGGSPKDSREMFVFCFLMVTFAYVFFPILVVWLICRHMRGFWG